jgi:two-component system LytT family sensor kinase
MKTQLSVMFHFLFWIFTSLLVVLVFQIMQASAWVIFESRIAFDLKDHLKGILFTLPVGACIFYSSYFSFPFFARRSVRFVWLLCGLLLLTVLLFIPGFLQQRSVNRGMNIDHVRATLSTVLILAPVAYFIIMGFLFRTFIEWIRDRKIKAELEAEKISSQLELIKAQINPHFLFNTINNIDVLIQKDPPKASEYLNKLSDIMRFMLYETKAEKISLSKELSYIEKYMELQKIRTSNSTYAKYEVKGEPGNLVIEPMLFIPFIENAFKHAENKKIENAIKVSFVIEKDQIRFECENAYSGEKQMKPEHGGLGNELIQRRLALIYPGKHHFETSNKNGIYKVNLSVTL